MSRVLASMLVFVAMSGCGGVLDSLYVDGRDRDPYGEYGPYGRAGYPDAVYAQPFDYNARPPYALPPPYSVYGTGLQARGAPEIDDEDEENEERAERELEAEERRIAARTERAPGRAR